MDVYLNGLGIEIGQEKKGLSQSPSFALEFVKSTHLISNLVHLGDLNWSMNHIIKFRSLAELKVLGLSDNIYHRAFKKIQSLYRSLDQNNVLINWGGDHSVALSTLSAFKRNYPKGKILWIDAHADLNLPQYSLTGNLHGMPVGLLLDVEHSVVNFIPWLSQSKLKPSDIFYLGIRDLDDYEKYVIEEYKIPHLTSSQCQHLTPGEAANIIETWLNHQPLHISLDIDGIDPTEAPATGCPVADGLKTNWLAQVLYLLRSHTIPSMDIVELNPKLGSAAEVFQTFHTAFFLFNQIFVPQEGGYRELNSHTKNKNVMLSSPPVYPAHWVLF